MQEFFENIVDKFLEQNENHKVYPLEYGIDSLMLRLPLISKAKKSIKIKTFLWRNDFSGNFILDKLYERAKSGIQIDLLIDHWDFLHDKESISKKIYSFSDHKNFNVKLFNPVNTENEEINFKTYIYELPKFSLLQKRMHGKIFSIDDKCCIVGGRNLGDEYFDLHLHRNFTDKEIIYSGKEIAVVNQSFNEYWNSNFSVNIDDLITVKDSYKEKEFRNEFLNYVTFKEKRLEALGKFSDKLLYYPTKVRFVYDPLDSELLNTNHTGNECLSILKKAKKSINVCSALLIFPENYFRVLRKLKKKGVDISIVTNSLTSSDNLYTYTAAISQRHKLISKITKSFHEIMPVPKDINNYIPNYKQLLCKVKKQTKAPKSGFGSNKYESKELHTTLHSKYFIIDQKQLLIGSMHLDIRALNINTETFFLIEDPSLAKRFIQIQEKWKKNTNSWILAPRHLNTFKKLIRFINFIIDKLNLKKKVTFNFINCFKPKNSILEEIPDISTKDFYKKYECCGVYANTLEVDQDIELFLIKQYSNLMKDLL